MKALMYVELRKLATLRGPAALAAAGLLYSVANAVATVAFAGHEGSAPLGDVATLANVLRSGSVTSWVALIAGIVAAAGEYQHRTITSTLSSAHGATGSSAPRQRPWRSSEPATPVQLSSPASPWPCPPSSVMTSNYV